jgi:signal transduction histidine kinase
MSKATPDGGNAAERRLEQAMVVAPYFLLVASLILAWTTDPRAATRMPQTIALSVVAGVWIYVMVVRGVASPERPLAGAIYIAGLVLLIGLLMRQSPWFGFFAWIGYAHSWDILRGRWRLVGGAAVAATYVTLLGGGLPDDAAGWLAWGVFVGGIVMIVGVFGSWGDSVAARSEQRRVVIDELAAANERLEALVRENDALQAQLVDQARTAGALDERQRMAREIHDTLAQGLTGVITQLEAADQAHGRPTELKRHLDNAARLARESLSEARRSVRAIGPAPLDDARLPDALAEVAARWSSLNGIAAEATTTGEPIPLHPEVEVTLLRVAQEALANVARHGRATRAGITLSFMEDLVTLDVRDDGIGFEADQARARPSGGAAGGFGLVAMRQRVDGVGGRLEVESEPGHGTAISVSVPIGSAEAVGA